MRAKAFEYGGFNYFVAVCLVTIFVASFRAATIHYPIFEAATRHIFNAEPAYGFAYTPGSAYATLWLYSPSCALFFFSLFAFLPVWLGKLFYLILSSFVFISGLLAFASVVNWRERCLRAHAFWFLLSFEMVGALSAFKIEIISVGIFCWTLWFLAKGREVTAALLLAMVTNWKFQGLPLAGLLIVAQTIRCRSPRFAVWFVVGLTGYSLLPFLFLPTDYLVDSYRIWSSSLSEAMLTTWTTYQHLFATVSNMRPGILTLHQAQMISAAIGILMAVSVGYQAQRGRGSRSLALGLASGYLVVFSPMSQSLAYILWAPLLLLGWTLFDQSAQRRQWLWILILAGFLASVSYSDLTPEPIRGHLRLWNVKPWGVLLLLIAVWRENLRRAKWN